MPLSLTPSQKSLILRVINCFESGSPEGNYGALSVYADGPHGTRQITYGRSQVTEYGNLKRLVALYVKGKGIYAGELGKYLGDIGSIPLVDDKECKALLRSAGRRDPVMASVQDAFFEEEYFRPALIKENPSIPPFAKGGASSLNKMTCPETDSLCDRAHSLPGECSAQRACERSVCTENQLSLLILPPSAISLQPGRRLTILSLAPP